MLNFHDLSIRKKLILSLMGISSLAVLVACIAFYAMIIGKYQQSYSRDLSSLAKVIGFNCKAALSFGIHEDAEQVLTSLRKRPSIIAAKIFDQNGHVFAVYGSPSLINRNPMSVDMANEIEKPSGALLIYQDIEVNGLLIGRIMLLDDMKSIHHFRKIALATLAAIVFTVIGLSFAVSTKLREIIAKPISELDEISNAITEKQDFTLRAVKYGSDEVGHLVETFNKMIEQIDQRNSELQASERRFRSLVDQAVDAFFLFDEDGYLIDVNQRACDGLGYTREELLAMPLADIDLRLSDSGPDTSEKKQYWQNLKPNSPVNLQSSYKRRDGSTFPVELRVGLLEIADQKVIMALARDISERLETEREKKQLEYQLQQAQKMESIGTLAAGIAHDFNNILSPIYGYVELALMEVQDNRKLTGFLNEVENAAHRAQDLVKQILTFSRQNTEKFSPVEVKLIVKEALKLLRSTIPSTIEIKQDIALDCGYVLANPTQIHQIIMNLCTNAYYAMKDKGGTLAVGLHAMEISPQDMIKNINLKPGFYLCLEVSDSGCGIAPENMERIFEPYFTTKPHGEGTGMGLSVVHGIIKKHGGDITVYSEPDRGTTFHVYLPMIEKTVSKTAIDHTEEVLPGTERILLVDDEPTVVQVETEMLESLGYTVKAFTAPLEALEHFKADPQAYDLVITDMTMPKMTGNILARELTAIRPDIPILLCTGFSDLINGTTAEELGVRKFFTKPFMIAKLARTLREVFDS